MANLPKFLRRRTVDERTGSMTVIEHLEELRHRLVVSVMALTVGAIAGWFLYNPFLNLIQHPFCTYVHSLPRNEQPPAGCRLVANGVLDPMLSKLKVVVFLGLFLALPILLYQLWAFIVPGLTSREKKLSVPFIVSSMLLFLLGAFVAIVMLPKGLNFLLGFAGPDITPLITFASYVGFVVLLTLAFGLSFEFPILLVFLTLVGVLSSAKLRAWRRWAILGIAIFAAVVTPSSDPYTMLSMMIPMYVFYEASIIIARIMKK
jgi:Twin arginine targeting (Tat) protein translocase TatC